MEHKKQEKVEKTQPPGEATKADTGLDEAECRCKEAQGKTMTDFIKVMIDDLAFWRKKH